MYRLIAVSGMIDKKSNNKDDLIRFASCHRGVFTLWQWAGNQWKIIETFIF
jgi:hypothetical protein